MKHLKTIAAAALIALGAGTASAASCTSSFALGSMGPPGAQLLGNAFTSVGDFTDCYSFTLASSAVALGLTLEFEGIYNISSALDIDITKISLSGGTLASAVSSGIDAFIPGGTFFGFSGLGAGTYELAIAGSVTSKPYGGQINYSGYNGVLTTAPVPEPETYAMLALGLVAAGWSARRRKPNA